MYDMLLQQVKVLFLPQKKRYLIFCSEFCSFMHFPFNNKVLLALFFSKKHLFQFLDIYDIVTCVATIFDYKLVLFLVTFINICSKNLIYPVHFINKPSEVM